MFDILNTDWVITKPQHSKLLQQGDTTTLLSKKRILFITKRLYHIK
jgi:hypothetical protein